MTDVERHIRCQRCGAEMEMRDPGPGMPWAPDQFWVCPSAAAISGRLTRPDRARRTADKAKPATEPVLLTSDGLPHDLRFDLDDDPDDDPDEDDDIDEDDEDDDDDDDDEDDEDDERRRNVAGRDRCHRPFR